MGMRPIGGDGQIIKGDPQRAHVELVDTVLKVEHEISTPATGEDVGVLHSVAAVAAVAVEGINAGIAGQSVGTGLAHQHIIAATAAHAVVASSTPQKVCPRSSRHQVGATLSINLRSSAQS